MLPHRNYRVRIDNDTASKNPYRNVYCEHSAPRFISPKAKEVYTYPLKNVNKNSICIEYVAGSHLMAHNAYKAPTALLFKEELNSGCCLQWSYNVTRKTNEDGTSHLQFSHPLFEVPKDFIFVDDILIQTLPSDKYGFPKIKMGIKSNIWIALLKAQYINQKECEIKSIMFRENQMNSPTFEQFLHDRNWFDLDSSCTLYGEEFYEGPDETKSKICCVFGHDYHFETGYRLHGRGSLKINFNWDEASKMNIPSPELLFFNISFIFRP